MTFGGFVYMVTAEETCLTPVGDPHAEPMLSPFTSGFFPSETASKAYWGLAVKGLPNCSSHCHLPFWGVVGLFFLCCGAVKGSLMPCCSSERCVMMSREGAGGDGTWSRKAAQEAGDRKSRKDQEEVTKGSYRPQ